MKKIFLLILIIIPITVKAGTSYTVMDMDTNRVLLNQNQEEKKLIASTTKIMTALVTLNNVSDINKTITVKDEVLKSYGSGIYIEIGEHIKIKDLLYGLMLRSGNDAAIELAYNVSGSMEGFVLNMNELANSIGMKNTTFINSHGLENEFGEGNISTSYDMALLSSYAMKNKTYKAIVKTSKYTVKTDKKTYIWHNKNRLLNEYKYCTGGKTGFTKKARRTLVTTASKDNMNITVVTLNDPNDFANHQKYYEEIFKDYKKYQILNTKKTIMNNKKYYIKNNFYMTLTKDEYLKIKTDIIMYENSVNKKVGEYIVKLDGKTYHKEPIYLKDNQQKKKLKWYQKLFKEDNKNG